MKTKPEESMFLTAKILKSPEVFPGNSEAFGDLEKLSHSIDPSVFPLHCVPLYTAVPPYRQGIHSKIHSGCLKPWIGLNPIYTMCNHLLLAVNGLVSLVSGDPFI